MNWFFITLGTALVLLLSAAMVGPHFVDWTAHRAAIEANAERVLGTEVSIAGEAEVRLLPRPRIELTDVRVGPAEAPLLEAETLHLAIDLGSLLRREIRILELRLGAPALALAIGEDGRFRLPRFAPDPSLGGLLDPHRIAVENATAEGMRAVVVDERTGKTSVLEDVDLTASARSLRGPFSANGTARIAGVEQSLRIAGGTLDASGALALSVRMTPASDEVTLGFDGTADLSAAGPRLAGEFVAEGLGATPWSIRSGMAVDTSVVTLADARLVYGPQTAPLELTGRAFLALGEKEPLAITLEAQQLDLDRIHRIASGEEAPEDPAALVAAPAAPPAETLERIVAHAAPLVSGLGRVAGPGLDAVATLDVGTVLAGGSVVRDVSAELRTRYGRFELARAEALLPGDTLVEVSGRLGAGFSGRVVVQSSRPSLLARWWTGKAVSGVVLDPLLVDADVDLGADAVEAQRLSARLGDTTVAGRARYRFGDDGGATLDVAVAAPLLEAADVMDAARLLAAAGVSVAGGTDVLLDLAVDRLRLGSVEGDSLTLDAVYRDDTLTLHALFAEDLAGARILASGDIAGLTATPAGRIEGTVELADGAPLAAALRSMFPASGAAERIAKVMPELAPGRLRVTLAGRAGSTSPALTASVAGTLGGSEVTLEASGAPFAEDWRERPAFLAFSAANDDAGVLARQAGVRAGEAADIGAGAVRLEAGGRPGRGMETTLTVAAGEDSAEYAGTLTLGGSLGLSGAARVAVADLARLSPLLATPLPDAGAVALSADLESGADGSLAMRRLSGTVGGVDVSGSLVADETGVRGDVSTGMIDLAGLATLVLGEDAFAGEPGEPWPTAVLAPPLLPGIPVALSIEAGGLAVGDRLLEDARFALALDDEGLSIGDLSARLAGGTVSGELSLARAGSRATVAARIALEGVPAGDLAWQRNGEPVVTGRASVSADVQSSGFSVANLVAGLSGDGALRIDDGEIRGINPAPFPLLEAALTAETMPPEEEIANAFARHLDAGALPFERLSADLAISAGAVRMRDVELAADGPAALSSALLDLAAWRLASDWVVDVPLPGGGTEAARITIAGPIDAPARQVDVASLASWLSLKRLERQVEAVEEQNEELAAEAAAVDPTFPGLEALEGAEQEGSLEVTPPLAVPDDGGMQPSTDGPAGGRSEAPPVPRPSPVSPLAGSGGGGGDDSAASVVPALPELRDIAADTPAGNGRAGTQSAAESGGNPAASVAAPPPPEDARESRAALEPAADRPAGEAAIADGQGIAVPSPAGESGEYGPGELADVSDAAGITERSEGRAGERSQSPPAAAALAGEAPAGATGSQSTEFAEARPDGAVAPGAAGETPPGDRAATGGPGGEADADDGAAGETRSADAAVAVVAPGGAAEDTPSVPAGDEPREAPVEAASGETDSVGPVEVAGTDPFIAIAPAEAPRGPPPHAAAPPEPAAPGALRPDGTIADGSDPIGEILRSSLREVDEAIEDFEASEAAREERRREIFRRLGIVDTSPAAPFEIAPEDVLPVP